MLNCRECLNYIKKNASVDDKGVIHISEKDIVNSINNWLLLDKNANIFSVKYTNADMVTKEDYLLIKYSKDTDTAHFSLCTGDTVYYTDGIVVGPYSRIVIEFLEFVED